MDGPAGDAVPGLRSAPPATARRAFSRLPPGALWEAFLPGADPAAAIGLLGEAAVPTLAAALRCSPDPGAVLRGLGYPFEAPDAEALAGAVLEDGRRRRPAPVPPPAGNRTDLGPRSRWEALVSACVDHAAGLVRAGEPLDPLDALLECPSGDLRALVPLADADARDRFAAGLREAAGDPGAFARGYFRASAAAGLMQAVRAALEAVPGGTLGRDEEGWPVWWEPSPEGVAPDAEAPSPAPPPSGHAVLVSPAQAAAMVPGWPEGPWLVAMRGRDGRDRWEAALADEIPDVLAGLPAWPPTPGLGVSRAGAPEEIRLLGRVAGEPGIAAAAAARIASAAASDKEISAEDVDW